MRETSEIALVRPILFTFERKLAFVNANRGRQVIMMTGRPTDIFIADLAPLANQKRTRIECVKNVK